MQEKILIEIHYSLDDLPSVTSDLLSKGLFNYSVCVLEGDLGAGKTTLVKYLIKALELPDQVTSPTFSLVNEYGDKENPIYHLDLYRLEQPSEVEEIGIEVYLDSGFCFIEWADLAQDFLPDKYCKIEIENLGNFTRFLRFKEIIF